MMNEKPKQEIKSLDFSWNEDDQFKVERMLDKKTFKGKIYYLVKWEGFAVELSTWQEASSLSHLSALIRNFQKRYQPKKEFLENEQLVNPYIATENQGHFLYGDKVKKVVNTFINFEREKRQKKVYLELQWENREENGKVEKPNNTVMDTDVIIVYDPEWLLTFYEKCIRSKK